MTVALQQGADLTLVLNVRSRLGHPRCDPTRAGHEHVHLRIYFSFCERQSTDLVPAPRSNAAQNGSTHAPAPQGLPCTVACRRLRLI
jgi:hypothetical protein